MSELLKDFMKGRHIEGYDEQKAKEAEENDYWQEIVRYEQNKMLVQKTLEGIETHFGLPCAITYIGNIKGIIPIHEFGINKGGHINNREDLEGEDEVKDKLDNSYRFLRSIIGQKIAFIIKGHDRKENLFTASRKEAVEIMKETTKEKMVSGSKTLAVIRNVNPYRAIADIGGIPAILPAAEYRHGWTDDLTEHLKVGDHVKTQVIDFDKVQGNAVISRKVLTPDPWENLEIIEKSEYQGEITGIRENGCFFRIKTKGGYVDGFFTHPKHEIINKGDKALVRILNINQHKKFILGLYIRPINVA